MITNEEYLASLHARIGQVARAMLSGERSFLEGAFELASLGRQAELAEEPDFMVFTTVTSEVDHLPVGAQRKHWSPSALERLEPELQKAEQWARQITGGACEALAHRFAT